jgi:hypothetical protein
MLLTPPLFLGRYLPSEYHTMCTHLKRYRTRTGAFTAMLMHARDGAEHIVIGGEQPSASV